MAKRSVGSMLVVVVAPGFRFLPRIIDRFERMDVEAMPPGVVTRGEILPPQCPRVGQPRA
jgi:hypothetical protein